MESLIVLGVKQFHQLMLMCIPSSIITRPTLMLSAGGRK